MNRQIVCPAIYKHFKHSENTGIINNYLYATLATSIPLISFEEELKNALQKGVYTLKVWHTELEKKLIIMNINGNYYHNAEEEIDSLVIYKSLYDNHICYARPYLMFNSKVDKAKYPNVKQEYRFERY